MYQHVLTYVVLSRKLAPLLFACRRQITVIGANTRRISDLRLTQQFVFCIYYCDLVRHSRKLAVV